MRDLEDEYETVENAASVDENTIIENGASEQQPVENEICRDFKKGDCRRGERCIYHHPKLDICRDFQNGRCMRQSCKFVHVSREQEENYTRSGILPSQVNNEQVMKNNVINAMAGLGFNNGILGRGNFGMSGMPPAPMAVQETCRDFEKGDCRRGSRCRFYHPKLKICRDFQNQKCERESCKFLHLTRDEEETYEGSGILPDHIDKEEVKKKKVMTPPPAVGGAATGMNELYGKRRRDENLDSIAGLSNISLVAILQENQTLKTKLAEMQQQITDLRRMNDTLYEQNNNYRNQNRGVVF